MPNNVKMNKKLVLACVIMAIMTLQIRADDTPPIGYEILTSENHLHTWNQNPLGDDKAHIWFNGSSGYLQFFNGLNVSDARSRATWLTHNFGLAYEYANGTILYLSRDHLQNSTSELSTDNLTFWQQDLYKCKTVLGRYFCAGWRRGQEVNDELMKNHFFFLANGTPITLPRNLYYVWEFEDVNIENGGAPDYFEYCNMSAHFVVENETTNYTKSIEQCWRHFFGDSRSIKANNLTQFYIRDYETDRGHSIYFNYTGNHSLQYKGGTNDVKVITNLGKLTSFSGFMKVPMWWIDDELTNMAPLATGNYSGYIQASGLGGITVYPNTIAKVGRTVTTSTWYHGFVGFNVSAVHQNATVTNVSFYHIYNTITTGSPTRWRTQLYTHDTINKLASGDENKGTLAVSIDWPTYCGFPVTKPCKGWHILCADSTKTACKNVDKAKQNISVYTVRLKDYSLYSWPNYVWAHDPLTAGRTKCLLNITYTVGYCDTSYYGVKDWQISEPVHCVDEGTLQVNGSIIIEAMFLLDNTNITFNDTDRYVLGTENHTIIGDENSSVGKII